jgi:hypothetical protein
MRGGGGGVKLFKERVEQKDTLPGILEEQLFCRVTANFFASALAATVLPLGPSPIIKTRI